MKKFALILSLLGLVGCFENVFGPTTVPSPSPADIVATSSPSPKPQDPCEASRLSLTGKIGVVPVYSFPLNQFVTLDADYVFLDGDLAAENHCLSLQFVELWSIKEGHGDLYGDLNSATAVFVASGPGNVIIDVNALDHSKNLVVGEWKGLAKLEGQAFDNPNLSGLTLLDHR